MNVKRIAVLTIIFVLLGISIFKIYEYINDDYRLFQQSKDTYLKAEKHIENNKYDKAIQLLSAMEKDYADNQYVGLVKYLKGVALYYTEEYELSLEQIGYAKFFIENNKDNKIHNSDKMLRNISVYQAMALSQLGEYKLSNNIFNEFVNTENLKGFSDFSPEEIKYQYAYNKAQMSEYDQVEKLLKEVISKSDNKELVGKSYDLLTNYYKNYLNDDDKLQNHYLSAFYKTENLKYLSSLFELYIAHNKDSLVLKLINDNQELLVDENPYSANITTFLGIIEFNKQDYNQAFLTLDKAEQILSLHKDKDDYFYVFEMIKLYKLYIYYELEEYEQALTIVNELNDSDEVTSDVKSIANDYKKMIDDILNITD